MIPVPHGLMEVEPIRHQTLYQVQRGQIRHPTLEQDGAIPKVI